MYYPELSLTNISQALCLIALSCILVYRELCPSTQLKYSKFSNSSYQKNNAFMIPSVYGMLLVYTPSMLVCNTLLLHSNKRLCWVLFLMSLHYLKRVLEVLFVHKYSGSSRLIDNCIISISYTTFSILVYVFSLQVNTFKTSDMVIGTFVFLFGEAFNFYHHYLLSRLRDTTKEYTIPCEGFFQYSWCPHYVGEIISFLGIVLMTQHAYILILQLGSMGYLAVRAYNTREWYKQKFEHVPARACLLPYIF